MAWDGVARVLLVVCVLVMPLGGGCSSPYDATIPAKLQDIEKAPALKDAVQKLKPEEKELVARFLLRSALGEAFGGPAGKETTVRQAIEEQKTFEAKVAAQQAEEKALAERVRAEREAAIAKMNGMLTVALTRLDFRESNYRAGVFDDAFLIDVAFENKSSSPLAGVKGALRFADMFDDEIKTVGMSVDEAIPVGETLKWSGELGHNKFMDEDRRLRATPIEKLKVSWIPEVYLLADGSRMEAPR